MLLLVTLRYLALEIICYSLRGLKSSKSALCIERGMKGPLAWVCTRMPLSPNLDPPVARDTLEAKAWLHVQLIAAVPRSKGVHQGYMVHWLGKGFKQGWVALKVLLAKVLVELPAVVP